ncbi:MAG TPA: response regulator [Candidatus Acidoferrum sp.]|jgi:CheY-like chemotaxis protein|nr:response regulator [Candidatus Acidoferrum sp.]
MSDAIVLPEAGAAEPRRTPTVYFIDDSATMREVIKIAFRRESINVVTCADAASALAQFEENPPDVVITDVIMPDQDGYSVCSQVKQNPQFAKTPVILMSGVVNKSVADRAVAVQADELVRKPFQPQELISRVKNLIGHGTPALQQPSERPMAVSSLSTLFSAPAAAPRIVPPPAPMHAPPPPAEARPADNVWPRALAEAFVQQGNAAAAQTPPAVPSTAPRAAGTATDIQKLRVEISRLEILVKKLQTELQIERQYNQALELHVRTLTQVD